MICLSDNVVHFFVWRRLLDEQQSQQHVDNNEMLSDLRAALDVERCRAMKVAAELELVQEQSCSGVGSNGQVTELQEKVVQLMVTRCV